MRVREAVLKLVSLLVPPPSRSRWLEEWRAEIQYGGWRMLPGALPDALAIRRLAARPPRPGALPRSSRNLFHAIDQDVRYSTRGLIASPGFALGVALSLALGMAATTAAFSLVNELALRPPAGIEAVHEVVRIRLDRWIEGLPHQRSTYEAFVELRDSVETLSGLAAHRAVEMTVAFPGEAIQVPGMLVSGGYFNLLGVRPAAGRLIGLADDRAPGESPVAVLSHDAWLRHFAGNPAVIGSTMRINGAPLQVVGIAPPGFRGLRPEIDEDEGTSVWIPMSMSQVSLRDTAGNPVSIEKAPRSPVVLVGRLRPGTTREAAQSELGVLAAALDRGDTSKPPTQAKVTGLGSDNMAASVASFMWVPLIVLALACVNAANLLSSRATRRIRDVALRLSVGATAWRIVRQLLVESLLLALCGAALGLAFTWWMVAAFESFFPIEVHIDWRVVGFALGSAVVTAFAFGLAPGLSVATRADDLVRGIARRPGARMRALLIGVQAALSLSLLATGWQFTKTVRVHAQNDGLQAADRLVLASIDVGQLVWPQAEVEAYYSHVLDRVRQLPGVTHAALSCACDPWGVWNMRGGGSVSVWLPHHAPDKPGSALAMLSAGDLVGAMELPIVAGRAFRPEEHHGPVRAVLVNQPLAQKHLGPNPVGQSIRVAPSGGNYAESQPAVVVGVVQRPAARRTDSLPMIYYPSPLQNMASRTLYIRFDRSADRMIPLVHSAIRELNADVPRPEVATAEMRRWKRNESDQFLAAAVSLLGVLALLLSAGGLYGTVAFVVAMRSHEIAIRMAMGAKAGTVVRMIVRQSLRPALIGAPIGAFAAAVTAMLVQSRQLGASAADPVAFGGATALLLGVLLVASAFPARRAARIDPIEVLRTE